MYRYLVTILHEDPFFTDNFDVKNHFVSSMTVYDLKEGVYTNDGINWFQVEVDHL